jgi:hypothetical protein
MLLSAVWMLAQYGTQSSTPQSSEPSSSTTTTTQSTTTSQTTPSSTANETSFTGCLQGSSGNFNLIDNTGRTYQLQGDSTQLSSHVGQEVSIMGSPIAGESQSASAQGGVTGQSAQATASQGEASSSSSAAANPSSNTGSMANPSSSASSTSPAAATGTAGAINVTSVSKVSDTCSASK